MLDKTHIYFDNTMLAAYKDCPRRFQLRHRLHWRSAGTSMPLVFGLAWHAALDAVWSLAKSESPSKLLDAAVEAFNKCWQDQGLPAPGDLSLEDLELLGPRTPMVAAEMLHNYIHQRLPVLRDSELLASEQPFAVPIPGLERTWYVGRFDKVIKYQGQLLIIEHKTTSEYKANGGFRTSYVEGWYSDSQVKGYQFAGSLYYEGLREVWVDAALVHKSVHNAFRFIPIAHQRVLLEEWLTNTKEWISRILADCETNAFPKNEGQCIGKFGACPFINICRTTADPAALGEAPEGYVAEPWEPFDILQVERALA